MDSHNTDPLITRTNFFGPAKSPWFYTEMPTDNTDSVSMDFLITQTPFLAHRVLHCSRAMLMFV